MMVKYMKLPQGASNLQQLCGEKQAHSETLSFISVSNVSWELKKVR